MQPGQQPENGCKRAHLRKQGIQHGQRPNQADAPPSIVQRIVKPRDLKQGNALERRHLVLQQRIRVNGKPPAGVIAHRHDHTPGGAADAGYKGKNPNQRHRVLNLPLRHLLHNPLGHPQPGQRKQPAHQAAQRLAHKNTRMERPAHTNRTRRQRPHAGGHSHPVEKTDHTPLLSPHRSFDLRLNHSGEHEIRPYKRISARLIYSRPASQSWLSQSSHRRARSTRASRTVSA